VTASLQRWLQDWAPLAEWVVAAATLGLAGATFKLATKTSQLAGSTTREIEISTQTLEEVQRQAASAERQVGVSQDTLAATFRPVLLDVTPDWAGFPTGFVEEFQYDRGPYVTLAPANRSRVDFMQGSGRVFVSVPVRNAGEGIAFITTTAVRWSAENETSGKPASASIAPGQVTRIRYSIDEDATLINAVHQYGSISAIVVYEDLGGNVWNTRLDLSRGERNPNAWYVAQVFVKRHGADDSEAVGSGVMAEP
jgi:hypothetical protein